MSHIFLFKSMKNFHLFSKHTKVTRVIHNMKKKKNFNTIDCLYNCNCLVTLFFSFLSLSDHVHLCSWIIIYSLLPSNILVWLREPLHPEWLNKILFVSSNERISRPKPLSHKIWTFFLSSGYFSTITPLAITERKGSISSLFFVLFFVCLFVCFTDDQRQGVVCLGMA